MRRLDERKRERDVEDRKRRQEEQEERQRAQEEERRRVALEEERKRREEVDKERRRKEEERKRLEEDRKRQEEESRRLWEEERRRQIELRRGTLRQGVVSRSEGGGVRDQVSGRDERVQEEERWRAAEMLRRQRERERRRRARENQLREGQREHERREEERRREIEERNKRRLERERQNAARRKEQQYGFIGGASTEDLEGTSPGSLTINLEGGYVRGNTRNKITDWEERRQKQQKLWERSRIARQERLRKQRERYHHRERSIPGDRKKGRSSKNGDTTDRWNSNVSRLYSDRAKDISSTKEEKHHQSRVGNDKYERKDGKNHTGNTTIGELHGSRDKSSEQRRPAPDSADGFRIEVEGDNSYNLVAFTILTVTFPCTRAIYLAFSNTYIYPIKHSH